VKILWIQIGGGLHAGGLGGGGWGRGEVMGNQTINVGLVTNTQKKVKNFHVLKCWMFFFEG
jgi:hypothetical protein